MNKAYTIPHNNVKLSRDDWKSQLIGFDFDIQFKPRASNCVVDPLSGDCKISSLESNHEIEGKVVLHCCHYAVVHGVSCRT